MRVHSPIMEYYQYDILQDQELDKDSYGLFVEYDPIWLCEYNDGLPYARFDKNDFELEVNKVALTSEICDEFDNFYGKVYLTLVYPGSARIYKRTINISWILEKTIDWTKDTKVMAYPHVEVIYESEDRANIDLRLLGPSKIDITESNLEWTDYRYLLKKSMNLSSSEYSIHTSIDDPTRIRFDNDRCILSVLNDSTIDTTATIKLTNIYNDKVYTKLIKIG